ncbi:hypothetical protein M408DRAFT_152059 [Serendipita vermifera MAFF 305830]|uniref:Uncharacterized protein n=1 Tax=Serendipita vermifera MAFF 305830 TaxID=933852 RepID=A0A0C3BP95_SERVB|nr:hypothetical protein M408DRAFT_152059 [Serendipita vermifera MAFF 305830]
MGSNHSSLYDGNEVGGESQSSRGGNPIKEEATVTIKYTRSGPGGDTYEENRKIAGSWDTNHPRERLHFATKVVIGTSDLQGLSQYKLRPPLAGFRVNLTMGDSPFPDQNVTGPAPFVDLDGTPVFVGSAVHGGSKQPCKINPTASWKCLFATSGTEVAPTKNYNLLLIDDTFMEWVPTSKGRVPPGRIAVDGGHEEDGGRLYHAVTHWNNLDIPGRAGEQHVGYPLPYEYRAIFLTSNRAV